MGWDPNMPLGEHERAEWRLVIQMMRELGVVQAFGVTLGPPPTRLQQLESAARTAPPDQKPVLEQELAQELREQRINDLIDEYRDKLAATGREYTREQIMRLIPDDRLHEIAARDA